MSSLCTRFTRVSWKCALKSVKCHQITFPAVRSLNSLIREQGPLSYVQRMKLLQNFKEKTGINQTSIQQGKFLVCFKHRALLSDYKICWMSSSELNLDPKVLFDSSILLGISDSSELQLAVQIANLDPSVKNYVESKSNGNFADFRLALLMLSHTEASLASKAVAILNWHRKNKYCPSCGKQSLKNSSGSCRTCVECNEMCYPTLSPVGIVLITDESNSKLLLVRQARHPKGMYSCVAGYIDAGESLEDCIRREVAEEVGLTVENVVYKASQHWALPNSNLMIGCHAVVKGDEVIDIDKMELEDARWFTVDEVRNALAFVKENPINRVFHNEEGQFFVPPKGAVAHTLIETWLQEHS